jgi:hypothetical protein
MKTSHEPLRTICRFRSSRERSRSVYCVPSAVFLFFFCESRLLFYSRSGSKMNERTSDSSSRLYLIIRKSTVFATERHHDHFSEKWYGCKEKTRSSLLKNQIPYYLSKEKEKIKLTCSPHFIHSDSTSCTTFSSLSFGERVELLSVSFVSKLSV